MSGPLSVRELSGTRITRHLPWRLSAIIVGLLVLRVVLGPQLGISLNPFLLTVIGAVGLNVLMGTAGQISLGQAAFFGIGGFTAALLNGAFGLGFGAACLVALAAGALAGLLVGLPALRLKGLYAVLSTLALHFIVVFAISRYQYNLNAAAGFNLPVATLGSYQLQDAQEWFPLLAILATAAYYGHRRILASDLGRTWAAIRDRDRTAAMMGIDVGRLALLAFVLTGALIALAGCVTGYYQGAISSEQYDLPLAVNYVAMIVVGGMGRPAGAVVGAAIFTILPLVVRNVLLTAGGGFVPASAVFQWDQIVYGLLLMTFLFLAPEGVVVAAGSLWSRRRRIAARPDILRPADAVDAAATGLGLHVRGLVVRYGGGAALHGVSLDVQPAEVVVVLGANGAGKTSLLRAIAGFLPIESGRVVSGRLMLNDRDLAAVPPYERARRGVVMVPERDKVFMTLTVMENLRLSAVERDWQAQIQSVLDLFPALKPRLAQRAVLLSGGERQMLAIARALLLKPELLLVDETTLGLSPLMACEVMRKLRELAVARGTSVLIVEQNAKLALEIADRAYLLAHGRVVLAGPAAELRDTEALARAYLGSELSLV